MKFSKLFSLDDKFWLLIFKKSIEAFDKKFRFNKIKELIYYALFKYSFIIK